MKYGIEDNREMPSWYYDIKDGEAKKQHGRCTCRSTSTEPCSYCSEEWDDDDE